MSPKSGLAVLAFFCASCSGENASSEPTAVAPQSRSEGGSPKFATWSGRPHGRLAVTAGTLTITDQNCLALQGDEGPRAIAFPKDASSWDATSKSLVVSGAGLAVGTTITVAGGSVAREVASRDPSVSLNGCANGSLVFIVEKVLEGNR